MDSTTEFVTTETKTYKEGELIKGKDFIRLESPLILPPKNSLETNAQDIVGAINELKKGLDEGGGDNWSPPTDWPEVPEPSDYEIYLLVSADDFGNKTNEVMFSIVHPTDGIGGYGPLTVDWGDGTIETWSGLDENGDGEEWSSDFTHTYAAYGFYVIKITTTEKSCFFGTKTSYYRANWLIAKLGNEIIVGNGAENTQYGFNGQNRLRYVKMSGKGGLACRNCFSNCYALRKIDIAISPTTIPAYCFYYCYSLEKFDFSEVTEIAGYGVAFSGFTHIEAPLCKSISANGVRQSIHLRTFKAPKCTAVGDYAFTSIYTLTTIEFAEDCTFGANVFTSCYSLYPYLKT